MFAVISFDVGVRNLALCRLLCDFSAAELNADSADEEVLRHIEIQHWELVDIVTDATTPELKAKPKAKQVQPSIPEATSLMLAALRRRELGTPLPGVDATHVVVEQQPGGKFVNVSMKALSHVIQSFFVLTSPGFPVSFVSAKRKLAGQKKLPAVAEGEEKRAKGAQYASNKKFALAQARALLELTRNPDCARERLARWSKCDDLCDAFLQGYQYARSLLPKPPKQNRKRARSSPSSCVAAKAAKVAKVAFA